MEREGNKKLTIMTYKFTDLYVVAKDDCVLFNACVYDSVTAQSVCAIAKDQGYIDAEVITLSRALKSGYVY